MTYLATGLIVIWASGFLFLLVRALNFSRLALNNPASDKPYWDNADYLRFYFPFFLKRRNILEVATYFILSFVPFLPSFPYFSRRDIFGLGVNPAKLTETGRRYQRKAIRAEWTTVAWLIVGVVPVVWAASYLMAP